MSQEKVEKILDINELKFEKIGFISKKLKHQILKSDFLSLDLNTDPTQILSSKEIQQLGNELQYLTHLKKLQIQISSFYKLGNEGIKAIKDGIIKLQNLNSFYLTIQQQIDIEARGINELFQTFKYLNSLEDFQISIGSNNQIFNEGAQIIGENMKQLKNLKYLNLTILNNNGIDSNGFDDLVANLMFLNNLQELSFIYYDQIGEEGSYKLGLSLSKLSSLTSLNLYFFKENQIGLIGMKGLSEGLICLEKLTQLSLSIIQNNIGMEGAKFLAQGLSSMLQLKQLSLRIIQDEIGIEGVQHLGKSISKLKQLEKIECFLNDALSLELIYLIIELPFICLKKQFSLKYLSSFEKKQFWDMSNQGQLVDLNLKIDDGYKIGHLGAMALSRGLLNISEHFQKIASQECINKIQNENTKQSQNLDKINALNSLNLQILNQNDIGQEGAVAIGESLQKFKDLIKLTLVFGENNIGNVGTNFLCKCIGDLSNLIELNLFIEQNNIQFEGAYGVGQCINKLQNLHQLRLKIGAFNNISIQGAQEIGNGISRLQNLRILELEVGENQLQFEGIGYLTDGIKVLSNLDELSLNIKQNQIGSEGGKCLGNMFSSLMQLRYLTVFIDENNINQEGAIQLGKGLKSLVKLIKIQLDLEKNNIGMIGAEALVEGIKSLNITQMNFNYKDPECIIMISILEDLYNINPDQIKMCSIKQLKIKRDFINVERPNKYIKSINEMNISINTEDVNQLICLSLGLKLFPNLKIIELEFNGDIFDSKRFEQFTINLSSLKNLENLSLVFLQNQNKEQMNVINYMFDQSISKLTNLKSLSLRFLTSIDQQLIQDLGIGLSNLKGLYHFQISVQSEQTNLEKSLENIDRFFNSISSLQSLNFIIEQIPSNFNLHDFGISLKKLKNLKQLTLKMGMYNNKLFQDVEIMNSISQLQHLSYLKIINQASQYHQVFYNQLFGYQTIKYRDHKDILYRKSKRLVIFQQQENYTKQQKYMCF